MVGPAQATLRAGIAAPPACDYLPSLLLPDLARARLLARAALWIDALREASATTAREAAPPGRDAPRLAHVDLGQQGLLADETAAAFAARGCAEVFVLGEPQAHAAFGILCDALRARGLRVVHARAGEDAFDAFLAHWARGGALPLALRDEPSGRSWPELLVTHPGEAAPAVHGVVFEDAGDGRLVRRSAGPAGTLGGDIDAIHVHTVEDWTGAARARVGPRDLCALRLAPSSLGGGGEAGAFACLQELVKAFGEARVRLDIERVALPPDARCGGAPWAARLGLDVPAAGPSWLQRLAPPRQARAVATALRWQALGVDPLEELYAGNALPDRNAAMLVNIAP